MAIYKYTYENVCTFVCLSLCVCMCRRQIDTLAHLAIQSVSVHILASCFILVFGPPHISIQIIEMFYLLAALCAISVYSFVCILFINAIRHVIKNYPLHQCSEMSIETRQQPNG